MGFLGFTRFTGFKGFKGLIGFTGFIGFVGFTGFLGFQTPLNSKPETSNTCSPSLAYTRSVLGILFTFWVMGFLIYKKDPFFFLGEHGLSTLPRPLPSAACLVWRCPLFFRASTLLGFRGSGFSNTPNPKPYAPNPKP